MTDVKGLIERLEKLTGPDRQTDARIAEFVGWVPEGVNASLWNNANPKPSYWYSDGFGLPRYTASVDAAFAFAERALPGLSPGVSQNVHHGNWYAWLADAEQTDEGQFVSREVAEAHHDFSAPLAILIATLRALSPKEAAE